jgi:hypothetical protein
MRASQNPLWSGVRHETRAAGAPGHCAVSALERGSSRTKQESLLARYARIIHTPFVKNPG